VPTDQSNFSHTGTDTHGAGYYTILHQRARQTRKILNAMALLNKSRKGLWKLQARFDMINVLPPVSEEHPAQLVAYVQRTCDMQTDSQI